MATVPVVITYANGSYNVPTNTPVKSGDTVQFKAADENCKVYFSPSTYFGASLVINKGTPHNTTAPTVNGSVTVNICATSPTGTCTPGGGIAATASGSITIGSSPMP